MVQNFDLLSITVSLSAIFNLNQPRTSILKVIKSYCFLFNFSPHIHRLDRFFYVYG